MKISIFLISILDDRWCLTRPSEPSSAFVASLRGGAVTGRVGKALDQKGSKARRTLWRKGPYRGKEKEKKNQFQSSRQCYRIIQKWSSSNGRQTHACQKTKTKRGKENQNFSVSVVVKQKPDKRVRTIRFFSHLFLSTFYDSRLHRPHNIESRSSACPQRVLLYVQQQQQAIYDINK